LFSIHIRLKTCKLILPKIAISSDISTTPIPSQVITPTAENAWISISYTRPAAGTYTIAVTAADQDVPGSPFQLQSTTLPTPFAFTKTAVEFSGEGSEQLVKASLKDAIGSPYRVSVSGLQQLSLVASTIACVEQSPKKFILSSKYSDGSWEAPLSLTPGSEWAFTLQSQDQDGKMTEIQVPGSVAVSATGQLISKPSLIQALYVSGDGLENGEEKTIGFVSIRCIDQTNREDSWPKDSIKAAITCRESTPVEYTWTTDNQILFNRPSADNSPYFVRIWLERPNEALLEAMDSPFSVKVLKSMAKELSSDSSCSFNTISHEIGKLSEAVGVVLSSGGKRRMVSTELVILSNNQGKHILSLRQSHIANITQTSRSCSKILPRIKMVPTSSSTSQKDPASPSTASSTTPSKSRGAPYHRIRDHLYIYHSKISSYTANPPSRRSSELTSRPISTREISVPSSTLLWPLSKSRAIPSLRGTLSVRVKAIFSWRFRRWEPHQVNHLRFDNIG
jgi:hypothetical protein